MFLKFCFYWPLILLELLSFAYSQNLLINQYLDFNNLSISFDNEVLDLLVNYDWSGNNKELNNFVKDIVSLKVERIKVEHLPDKIVKYEKVADYFNYKLTNQGICLKNIMQEIEENLIVQALELSRGNKRLASKFLKIKRSQSFRPEFSCR